MKHHDNRFRLFREVNHGLKTTVRPKFLFFFFGGGAGKVVMRVTLGKPTAQNKATIKSGLNKIVKMLRYHTIFWSSRCLLPPPVDMMCMKKSLKHN